MVIRCGRYGEVNSMALKAYVLIEAAPGRSRDIAGHMQKIDGVRSVAVVTGPHDVIAYVDDDGCQSAWRSSDRQSSND